MYQLFITHRQKNSKNDSVFCRIFYKKHRCINRFSLTGKGTVKSLILSAILQHPEVSYLRQKNTQEKHNKNVTYSFKNTWFITTKDSVSQSFATGRYKKQQELLIFVTYSAKSLSLSCPSKKQKKKKTNESVLS